MKKLLALLLAAIMVFSMVACGNTPAADTPAETDAPAADAPAETEAPAEDSTALPFEGQTLKVSAGVFKTEDDDVAWYNEHIPEFEALTGAKVDIMSTTYSDLNTKQMADLIAGDAADILTIPGGAEYDYYSNGYLEDVTGYFTEEQTSDWIYWDGKAVGDAHYVVPFSGGVAYRCVFINKTILDELGLEMPASDGLTWDVMKEYGKKAVEAGYKGFVSPFSGNENAIICNYFGYVNQAGGTLANAEGQWDFTTPEALEAMTFVYDMFNTDKIIDTVSYDAVAAISEWVSGNALFVSASIGGIQGYLEEIDFEWNVAHLRNVSCGSFNTCDSFAVNAKSENKELAAAFLSWLLSAEVYNQWDLTIGACTKSADPDNYLIPEYQHLPGETDNVFFPPSAPHSAEIKEALQAHQQLCALGEETPEEALAAIQAVVDSFA